MKIIKIMSRCIKLISAFLLLCGFTLPTNFIINKYIFPSEDARTAKYSVKTTTGSFILKDGIKLVADIYSPDGLQKTPTILIRIPFSKTFSNTLRSGIIARYWAARGYTVVLQGTRGRYKSGGEFYPLINERDDGIQTLKWVAKQDWYDGRIAMWGGSAFGYTQWSIADEPDLNIKAFFIQIASSSFYKMFYPGDAFSLESAVYWAIRSHGAEDRDVDPKALDKGINHLPTIASADVAIGKTEFYHVWATNTKKNEYWEKIDGTDRAKNIQAPALLMGGWFDPFLPSLIDDFKTITTKAKPAVAKETRLIIGPWGHAESIKLPNSNTQIPYRGSSVTPSVTWFDYQLGVTNSPLNMPKVRIFVMGENNWRDENEWPLARTKYTPFYLHSDGKANTVDGDGNIDTNISTGQTGYDSYIYDPANPVPTAGGAILDDRSGIKLQNKIEKRPDVLVYTSSALTESLEVTGPVKAILYVATDAPSTDFTAKLADVYPDGSVYNISDGILRQTYKNSGTKKPEKIEIELWPTSNIFFKNHKIRLEISSSNFPRYDRNPNTGEFIPTATKTKPANQIIFHSQQYQSQLILPVIPNKEIRLEK